jgi:hypothetical protein
MLADLDVSHCGILGATIIATHEVYSWMQQKNELYLKYLA